MKEGGATPHTEGMQRAEGSWPLEGEQLGKAPLPTTPLSQEHRSGGCSQAFRFWCLQGAFSLGRREPMRHPWSGRVSFCLSVCTNAHSLTHAVRTHIYVCQAWLWNGERNTDTILIGQA